ncbi:NAD(P)H-hydrate dehydratase [Bacteroidales bacterium OttesenSCG-928-M06]|nr:NAD(P)H-hydrate dehydratase [Bacteroidales bacterium OttesenSCG-928-M06]
MKIFEVSQVRELDLYTIIHEPIASIDLMERASGKFVDAFVKEVSLGCPIVVFAGPGNNGGDALCVARLLIQKGYKIQAYLVNSKNVLSKDCEINRFRLVSLVDNLIELSDDLSLVEVGGDNVVIDGLFGSGLNKPLEGLMADLVCRINNSGAKVYSIDIPSGLFGEDNENNNPENIIRATRTFTFHNPKLAFLFPENEEYVGDWIVLDIGLHSEGALRIPSNYYLLEKKDILDLFRVRSKFAYKNKFGHALVVAGSKGKMGAAVLATQAALRVGAGLVTSHIPQRGEVVMQTAFPEAMVSLDKEENNVSHIDLENLYSSVGVGPGIGVEESTQQALKKLLCMVKVPLVLDADALNILALNKKMIDLLPVNTILTPHVGEFERLTQKHFSSYSRLMMARIFATTTHTILILKGAFTSICLPDGRVYFNSTGNPGMATAGSGDVLTGVLTGLLSQAYLPEEAALLGVFLHGLAGDIAAEMISCESMIATDIINNLGNGFKDIIST